MRLDLAVPYSDKDKAKNLGDRWGGIKRVWHLVDVGDLVSETRGGITTISNDTGEY